MKNIKIYLLLALYAGLMLLVSCKSSQPLNKEEISPYQKRADIVITNDNYQNTNNEINKLAKKFEGFVKTSSYDTDVKKNSTADYEIRVPYTFFNNLKNDFDKTFKNDIIEENVSDEESYTKLYYSNLSKIDEKTEALKNLRESYAASKDVNDRIVMKYEIDKLSTEVDNLQQRRLSLLESLNYSTVHVTWKEPKKEEPVDTNKPFVTIPGMPLMPPPPPKHIVFDHYGQEEEFGTEEPVTIGMESLDPEKTNIIAKVDPDEDEVEMKVTKKDEKETVVLDRKCQIVIVGLGKLPEIIRGDAIKHEQIVITPILDDNCNIIGNEIRAGTIQSGCTAGRKNYYRLLNCLRHGKPTVVKKKKVIIEKKVIRENPAHRQDDNDIFYFPLD